MASGAIQLCNKVVSIYRQVIGIARHLNQVSVVANWCMNRGGRRVKFAHFSHIWSKPGMTPHQRYEQLWRELTLCDDLDFDYGFCVEHHCRPDESWMSSPSLYAVGAGARTRRIRLGPMGYVVPLYHPLRLAEEIAIVDQMLGGRMECGLVPGITPDYFRPFGLGYEFRKSPTLEFVSYMRAAYGEKQPFSFHGDNHHTERRVHITRRRSDDLRDFGTDHTRYGD